MKLFKNILIVVLITTLAVAGYYVKTIKADYEDLTQSLIDSEEYHHIYVNEDEVLADSILVIDDMPWINYKIIKHYIDDDIWLSNSGSRIYIPLETLDLDFENENINHYVKSNLDAINIPLYTVDEEKYIDLSILEKLYALDYTHYGETQVLSVGNKRTVKLPVGTQTYSLIGNGDDVKISLEKFLTEKEENVVLLNEGTYTKVLFDDGRQAAVLTEALKDVEETVLTVATLELAKQVETPTKISMIWDDNLTREKMTAFYQEEAIEGLNVISPVWFNLNIEGIVINSGDVTYSRSAHEKGYQVWGLYKNDFNPDRTNDMLNSDHYVQKSISQLLFYASLYELDGINIDFENVYYKDKDVLTAYLKELSVLLDETDLLLTIDMTRPDGSERYSKVIDRQAMNDFMDYFILMAYDEHWGSSPIAGSVASMPWTERSVELSLEVVDREKLIMGIPLYTRLWKTSDGNVSSKAYSISYIDTVLEGKYFDYNYDESSGQNYLTYQEDGATYEVWAEDKLSLQKRIEMAENFHLPGVAMWRKGYETPYTWDYLEKYLQ